MNGIEAGAAPGAIGAPEKKHSGFGITSFVLAIGTVLADFIVILVAGIAGSQAGGMPDDSPIAIGVGLFIFLMLFVNLIGIALGAVGLFQSNAKKVFPILGILFNLVVPAGMVALIIFGLMVGSGGM